jgi:hypothetical protein
VQLEVLLLKGFHCIFARRPSEFRHGYPCLSAMAQNLRAVNLSRISLRHSSRPPALVAAASSSRSASTAARRSMRRLHWQHWARLRRLRQAGRRCRWCAIRTRVRSGTCRPRRGSRTRRCRTIDSRVHAALGGRTGRGLSAAAAEPRRKPSLASALRSPEWRGCGERSSGECRGRSGCWRTVPPVIQGNGTLHIPRAA